MLGMEFQFVDMLDTQWPLWADEEGQSSGLVPRVPFGDETSPSTWSDLGPEQLDMQLEFSSGQGGYWPIVYGDGSNDTVNPQELTLSRPSVPEVAFSGDAFWDPGDPTIPPEPFQDAFHEGGLPTEFDPAVLLEVSLPIRHLDEIPVSAGASIPGAPVFSVALPQVSHVSDM